MLPYVFVLDLHLMSFAELNESLSVLNSYDRELPSQLEKLRAAILQLQNKREAPACRHTNIVEDVRFADGVQKTTCKDITHDVTNCPVCLEQQ